MYVACGYVNGKRLYSKGEIISEELTGEQIEFLLKVGAVKEIGTPAPVKPAQNEPEGGEAPAEPAREPEEPDEPDEPTEEAEPAEEPEEA